MTRRNPGGARVTAVAGVGLCWLTHCKRHGVELASGMHRIVLCVEHRAEMESTADVGYSLCESPAGEGGAWWPWEPI